MLLGREAEQRRIDRLLSAARVGQSGALVLTGEAGIGKTSLLEHAAAAGGGMRVLHAEGARSEQDVPFAGLHQLLRPVLGDLDGPASPRTAALGVALGLWPGRSEDRFAVGAATLSLLARVAEDTPLLLLVDDVDLWDTPSAEALAFAGRRLLVDRVALLVASRAETGYPVLECGLPQVRLAGLSLAAVAALLANPGGGAAPSELAARLHKATAGNPLGVVELAGDLDALLPLSPQVPLPVPEVVRRAFGRRVATLPERTQTALLLAAVADGELATVVRAATDLDVSLDDLVPAERAGLVRITPGRVVFRHALTRASVYASAIPPVRRSVHRAVSAALPESDLERRVWHRCEATIGLDDTLAGDLDALAARATGRSAHAVTATARERAALLSTSDRGRAERFLAAADAAWLAGQVPRAEALLERAEALAQDPGLCGRIQGLRGTIALRAGSLDEARRSLEVAAGQLVPGDPDGAVVLLTDAVMASFFLADAAGGLQAARRVEGLLDRCRTEEARWRGEISIGVALVMAGRGGPDRLRAAVDGLLAQPGLTGDEHRPSWMLLGPLFLRESTTGRALVQHAVEQVRSRGALVTLANLLFHTARHDATTDRWESGATSYAEAIAVGRESGQTTDLTMALAGLAWLRSRTGDAEGCRALAREAEVLAERHRVHLGRLWAGFALGDLALGQGRLEEAEQHYARLEQMMRELGVLDVDLSPGPEHAEALQHLGRGEQAREVAYSYQARAVTKGQPWALARAERAIALTCADEGGAQHAGQHLDGYRGDAGQTAHFERALELHRGSADAFEEARTELAYGSALRRGRRRVDARPHLRSALATFEQLGARPWADRAAGELDATGETARRRGATGLDVLTAQERQISRMLADGRTTRETAAALFLSPKTVEYHLRHVYTKLDIGSRHELRDALGAASVDERGPGLA